MNIKSMQLATIAIVMISIFAIWQILNIYPEVGILQGKISSQESITKDSQDTLERLKELVNFTQKNKETINKFDLILPDDEGKASLLSSMNSLAAANGLSAVKIAFEGKKSQSAEQDASGVIVPISQNSDFDSSAIKMSLRGSYLSFKNFLTAVEKNLRVIDVSDIEFAADASSEAKEGDIKTYSFDVGLKFYLYKPSNGTNIAALLSSGEFKNFNAKSLGFIKEKVFSDLSLPPDYNINAGADEIGNQNIF